MNQGYSILLSEYIDAAETDYEDCKQFQIVCPECKEPIYKCHKKQSNTHYFSHYSVNVEMRSSCELRVASLGNSERDEHHRQSRGQRLKYFMDSFSQILANSPCYASSMQTTHRKMAKSTSISMFFNEVLIVAISQQGADSFFDACLIDFDYQIVKSGWELPTKFAAGVQKRIARDMWQTLNTKINQAYLQMLFRHAFIYVLSSFSAHKDSPQSAERSVGIQISEYMGRMLAVGKSRKYNSNLMLEMMNHHLPYGFNSELGVESAEPSSYFSRILGKISEAMIETLVGMPYAEMLAHKFGDNKLVYPKLMNHKS